MRHRELRRQATSVDGVISASSSSSSPSAAAAAGSVMYHAALSHRLIESSYITVFSTT